MRWQDTVASKCRYGDIAGNIFGGGDVIWEESYDDYQGHANVLVYMPDGSFAHYAWDYGSCSGCDTWEAAGLSDDAIEAEMSNGTAWLKNTEHLRRYLRLEGDEAANAPRMWNGEPASSFENMRATAEKWLTARGW
jgi:hypothetical protein